MKNPKKPTRSQKICMTEHRLNFKNWLVVNETDSELIVYNKLKGTTRILHKDR